MGDDALEPLQVFLSYSRADEKEVRRVHGLLALFGIDAWLDTADLLGGDDWRNKITESLQSCDAAVFCVSGQALTRKGFFLEEVELAVKLTRSAGCDFHLIPLRLEAATLPAPLGKLHSVDFFTSDGLDHLLAALRKVAEDNGRRPVPPAPAAVEGLADERSPFAPATADSGNGEAFAGYPVLEVGLPGGRPSSIRDRRTALLWGDPLVLEGGDVGKPLVRARGEHYQGAGAQIAMECPLSIELLELGGGCGALLVTPDGRKVLFNMGFDDHLCRYLQWRFDGPREVVELEAAVLADPRLTHGGGLRPLLDSGSFRIGALYHNGIFGHTSEWRTRLTKDRRHVKVLRSKKAFLAWLSANKPDRVAKTLGEGLESGRIGDLRMLARSSGHLPGFEPGKSDVVIEVIGPIDDKAGLPLPESRSRADTIRANTIVLKVSYGRLRFLLSGHLNREGHKQLLDTHAPDLEQALHADLAKLCYHGSKNFLPDFARAVSPVGVVAANGREGARLAVYDNAVGALAGEMEPGSLMITGERNLLLDEPEELIGLKRLLLELYEARTPAPVIPNLSPDSAALYQKVLRRLGTFLLRNHMVQLRSDGERAIFARRVPPGDRWSLAEFKEEGGRFRYRGTRITR